MFERLDDDARAGMLIGAREEVRRRGDRRIGTEHLLLGLLHDPRSPAARVLGVDLATARAAVDTLDRAALRAIGIDLGQQRLLPAAATARRPALTSGARAALKLSVEEARRTRARRIQARHLLAALLTLRRPDPAAELLDALGVDVEQVRARLADQT